VVPLEGVDKLDAIVSSPITILASPKMPARRAPRLGEHNDEILAQLGFSPRDIDDFRSAAVIPPAAAPHENNAS
jgi:crotonobetainyl-CoA:carnitine CoA-transferase CaiB-like acyl-CoA transferase